MLRMIRRVLAGAMPAGAARDRAGMDRMWFEVLVLAGAGVVLCVIAIAVVRLAQLLPV